MSFAFADLLPELQLLVMSLMDKQSLLGLRTASKSIMKLLDFHHFFFVVPFSNVVFFQNQWLSSTQKLQWLLKYFAHKKNFGLNFFNCRVLLQELLPLLPNGLLYLNLRDSQISCSLKLLPKNLQYLNLRDCKGLTDTHLSELPKSLTHLDISKAYTETTLITNKGIKKLPSKLKYLNLSGQDLTDESLKSLPKAIETIYVSQTEISDEALKNLPKTLKHASMAFCKKLTNEGLKNLPKSLTSINLSCCENIGDAGMKHLPKTLEGLQLACGLVGDGLTDEGLKMLPKTLTQLDISFSAHVTNKGIACLPTTLKSLNLTGCRGLTNECLDTLPATLIKMILKSTKITKEGLTGFKRERPSLLINSHEGSYEGLTDTSPLEASGDSSMGSVKLT